jgi:predicted dehydrogenase
MSRPTTNVCLIGHKFMGRTHSNAYLKVNKFFPELALVPKMHTVAGRNEAELKHFAEEWGWEHTTTDWKAAVQDPAIQLIDIGTPNNMHREMAIAALEAGKHVACEKPLAQNLAEAKEMLAIARKAKNSKTFVWYNYRRVPAVALAHQLAKAGKIGRVYHIRAYYLQDWAGPSVPLIWRFSKEVSGTGAHGDLGAHVIDMARFITGDEFAEVSGCITETFIKEREIPAQGSAGGIASGAAAAKGRMGKVTVDDATLFIARMKSGAMASVESTRFATGYQNKNGLEIHGEKGAIRFDFEDMNRLYFYDATTERKVQGWTQIMVTHGGDHPYAANWWPDAHILGYEHSFVNQVADMMSVLSGKPPVVPLPDFEDAYKTQLVLEAAMQSAQQQRPVKIAELE